VVDIRLQERISTIELRPGDVLVLFQGAARQHY
jgi:hypothetical protein